MILFGHEFKSSKYTHIEQNPNTNNVNFCASCMASSDDSKLYYNETTGWWYCVTNDCWKPKRKLFDGQYIIDEKNKK